MGATSQSNGIFFDDCATTALLGWAGRRGGREGGSVIIRDLKLVRTKGKIKLLNESDTTECLQEPRVKQDSK